jgi:hypothetical protein
MEIPWDLIGTLGLVSTITVALAVYIGRKLVDLLESRVSKPFESQLAKAEALYAKQVDLAAQIDLDLRNKREAAYKELWRLTGVLPRWPRANDVTYAKLMKRSGELQNWFFNGGGLYLSTKAREAYGVVQEALSSPPGVSEDDVITNTDYDRIVQLF